MITLLHPRVDRLKQQQKLLPTLTTAHKNRLPPQETWSSTRQVAEALNFVIYRTRYLQLHVVERKQVLVAKPVVNNSLCWLPTKKITDNGVLILSTISNIFALTKTTDMVAEIVRHPHNNIFQ